MLNNAKHFWPNSAYIAILSLFISICIPQAVYASPMAEVLCDVLSLIHGNVGTGLATLAVISVGVAAMAGKITMGTAVTVCVGIAIMFGSTWIAQQMLWGLVPSCS